MKTTMPVLRLIKRWLAVLLLCAVTSGAARADNRPLANVTLNGLADLGVVSPGQTSEAVLLTAFAPDPPGETIMAPPDGIVIPDLGLTFNWNGATIATTKLNAATNTYTEDGAQNGTVFLTPVDGTPDGAQHANLTASFPDPGKYRIAVSVSAQWWAGTGDYFVGTSNTITLDITVVNIEKLQYRLANNGVGQGEYSELPAAPDSLVVLLNQQVEFKAIPNPSNSGWPGGKPAWSKTGEGVTLPDGAGPGKIVTFTQIGDKTVSAECGNTVTVPIKVKVITFDFGIEKTVLLAGKLEEEFYQTPVTVTLKENGQILGGKSIAFTLENSDSDTPAAISAPGVGGAGNTLNVTTDQNGKATVILTSSKLIGATAKVKVAYGGVEKRSDEIQMVDAEGDMSVEADTMPADGQSTIDVYLLLNYQDEAVDEHHVTFRISRVWNASGVEVQPTNGAFPGYGTISTTQGTTDDIGLAYGTYTAGTLPGTIEFESANHSMLVEHAPLFASLRLVQALPDRSPRLLRKSGTGGGRPTARVSINIIRVTTPSGVPTTNTLSGTATRNALNRIWYSQAQIFFRFNEDFTTRLHNTAWEPRPGYLDFHYQGDAIDTAIRTTIDTSRRAGIHVHFIRSTECGDLGHGPQPGHWIVAQDGNGSKAGSVLGHEAGHNTSLPHTTNHGTGNLMYPAGYGGKRLTRNQANTANQYVASHQSEYNK